MLYKKDCHCRSRRRLYELLEAPGSGFLQIPKQMVVHQKYIRSVEADLGGVMLLKPSNGLDD